MRIAPACQYRAAVAAVFLVGAIPPALASGDHHGPPAAAPVQLAPRGHARTDNVEIVAVAAPGQRLVLYLDRRPTNEPLAGAEVTVEADGFPLELRDMGDGVYTASDWFAGPGPNALAVTYRAGDMEGRLDITVNVPQARGAAARAAAAAVRIEQANTGVVMAAAFVLYLAAMALFAWRARRQRAPAASS